MENMGHVTFAGAPAEGRGGRSLEPDVTVLPSQSNVPGNALIPDYRCLVKEDKFKDPFDMCCCSLLLTAFIWKLIDMVCKSSFSLLIKTE